MYTKRKLFLIVVTALMCGISVSAQDAGLNSRKPVTANQDLVIKIADITENALFYPVEIDGTRMEVLVVKAPNGTVRTAFNTCMVCYSSGRGYFVQAGTVLVCQNCGRRFRMNQVEVQTGGCNPVPIFPSDKTVTDTAITITQDYLKKAKGLFAKWKKA